MPYIYSWNSKIFDYVCNMVLRRCEMKIMQVKVESPNLDLNFSIPYSIRNTSLRK